MSEVLEWEWRVVDPAEHPNLEAEELHGAFALGELWALVALIQDEEDGPTWLYYTAPDPEDSWVGYESIDGFATLDEAKASVDSSRDEILAYIRMGSQN